MEDIREKKNEIRKEMIARIESMPEAEKTKSMRKLEDSLFGFANFMEANIALLFTNRSAEVDTRKIIQRGLANQKIIALPTFDADQREMIPMKIDNIKSDLIVGPQGYLEPDPGRCKRIPIDCIDIAIVPGLAFDEKGGRLGTGDGYYDRLMPKLPITTRKVALAFEKQIIPHVPMESHDKYVDIIITDTRIIYKI
ncbi:MAG: 5-formyltetrahydrofolate cyclo-ligase [Thermodesulfobacteriota bacterium]